MSTLKELEELIKIEETGGGKVPLVKNRDNPDVLKFITETGLQPGPMKVPTYLIYFHFRNWCRKKGIALWGKEEFFRTFKKNFKQKRNGNQRFYLINSAIDLSRETLEEAKRYEQAYQSRPKKSE